VKMHSVGRRRFPRYANLLACSPGGRGSTCSADLYSLVRDLSRLDISPSRANFDLDNWSSHLQTPRRRIFLREDAQNLVAVSIDAVFLAAPCLRPKRDGVDRSSYKVNARRRPDKQPKETASNKASYTNTNRSAYPPYLLLDFYLRS
jgi:hypothetical protein